MKRYLRIWLILFSLIFVLGWSIAPEPEDEGRDGPQQELPARQTPHRDEATVLRILHDGAVEKMDMSSYLTGVLRAEMPASFEMEALKAQAVAARTYTLYRMANGAAEAHPEADACDDIRCCKAYETAEEAASRWGGKAEEYEQKLCRAVEETDGEIMVYDGEPVLAVFFSSAAGRTQPSGAVWQRDLPYLKSVPSPETETLVPDYYSAVCFSREEFCSKIKAACPDARFEAGEPLCRILETEGGYVLRAQTGGLTLRGSDIRAALSLRSPCFTAEEKEDSILFHVTGYGHGVGMSQYGANILAGRGSSCEEILRHYYSGVSIVRRGEENIAKK